jgi:phosphoribulokinase
METETVPDKLIKMALTSSRSSSSPRPIMLAIAGDSATGKTTLARGLVDAIGAENCTSLCADDYHRYDRSERRNMPITPSNPECNYLDILEQHLQLLASGQPILKPVYDHATGALTRPEYIEPKPFVIIEGLLPLATKAMQACFDVSVYMHPPESIRLAWKIQRDCAERGYLRDDVLQEVDKRAPESESFIYPQRRDADIVLRFSPIATRNDPPETPLSAELLLRPTIRHPLLTTVLSDEDHTAMHLKIIRDIDGAPVERLHVHGHATPKESRMLETAIWADLAAHRELPAGLGALPNGTRSEPLAITQLILLYDLMQAERAS